MSKVIAGLAAIGVLAGIVAYQNGAKLPHWLPPLVISSTSQQAASKWVKDTGDYHRACAAKLRNHEFKTPNDLHDWLVQAGKTAHADLAPVTSPLSAAMTGADGKPLQTLNEEAAAKACEEIASDCGR